MFIVYTFIVIVVERYLPHGILAQEVELQADNHRARDWFVLQDKVVKRIK